MTTEATTVIGGVDTHKRTHYAAVLDEHGRLLDHREFPAADRGYQQLLAWIRGSRAMCRKTSSRLVRP